MSTLKYSRQRECIMNCLRSRYDHPTADMLYTAVREEYPHISLGTVYRNLSLMADHGEIIRFSCGEGIERFDGRIDCHYHFKCKVCGEVTDLDLEPMRHIDVLAGSGFSGHIDGHFTFFYGTCPLCMKQEADACMDACREDE